MRKAADDSDESKMCQARYNKKAHGSQPVGFACECSLFFRRRTDLVVDRQTVRGQGGLQGVVSSFIATGGGHELQTPAGHVLDDLDYRAAALGEFLLIVVIQRCCPAIQCQQGAIEIVQEALAIQVILAEKLIEILG